MDMAEYGEEALQPSTIICWPTIATAPLVSVEAAILTEKIWKKPIYAIM